MLGFVHLLKTADALEILEDLAAAEIAQQLGVLYMEPFLAWVS